MDNRLIAIPIFVLATLWLWSCATTGQLSGGPEDKIPPAVVESKSTQNFQTHFEQQAITLVFDEFVEVRNPLKEIIVSPPLTYLPKIDHRGKRVTFSFGEEEKLKENATYVINFGKAIVDFRAGNTLENYSFVFSTGPSIDSMTVSGTASDAKTGKPIADMLVMLYTDLRDSVPFLEKPFYATRTDKEGGWTISNVRADTFKLFGLVDANVNYLYDVPGEVIAPYDQLIILDSAKQAVEVELEAFSEPIPIRITEVDNKTLGVTKLVLNQAQRVDSLGWVSQQPAFAVKDQLRDTVYLFYPSDTTLAGQAIVLNGDTTSLRKSRGKVVPNLSIRDIAPPVTYPIASQDTVRLYLSTPIASFNQDSIRLADTSGLQQDFLLTSDKRTLLITPTWSDVNKTYTLELYPGSITDLYGQTLPDTMEVSLQPANTSNSGTLQLQVADLVRDSSNYILDLLDGNTTIKTYHTMDLADTVIVEEKAKATTYSVRLVRDVNRNRVQDGGQYLPRRYAESEKVITLQALKADWQLETDLQWAEPKVQQQDSTKVMSRDSIQTPVIER